MTELSELSSFWHWFVVILTVVGLAGCLLLLIINASGVSKDQEAGETHVWDEDLTEYDNPLPKWWFNLFLITLIFGAAYLVLYPGLGNFKGIFGWTQIGQYEAEMQSAQTEFGPLYEKYGAIEVRELALDPDALGMGKRLFASHCATCHGSDARGGVGFPNLTDAEWLYGDDPESIKTSITEGRNGVMPSWTAAIKEPVLDSIAQYVQSLSQGESKLDEAKVAEGKTHFGVFCIACHGADGVGNPALGAPSLTNDIWLYGGSKRAIMETLTEGRGGVMPAHGKFLGDDKIHLLTAYVYSMRQPTQ